jgi:hypothetical protein
VPFLRFSRDKRGYEHVYLVHAHIRRGKPSRPRVLYWYRTPPGIKVGRRPFDEEVQRTLEAQNPGVIFDWKTIIATPMPPPEPAEHWRERRRVERAAKQAQREDDELEAASPLEEASIESVDLPMAPIELQEEPEPLIASVASEPDDPPASATGSPVPVGVLGKRRRRRGGRHRHGRPDNAFGTGQVSVPVVQSAGSFESIESIEPIEHVEALEPIEPIESFALVEPFAPVEPFVPVEPVEPAESVGPVEPIEPTEPSEPLDE